MLRLYQNLLTVSFILTLLLTIPPKGMSEVKLGGRHVYILHGGIDVVWGTYLFLVTNSSDSPIKASLNLTLPQETIDFQGHSGIQKDDLELGPDGGLTLSKEFQKGENLISLGFKVPAWNGEAILNFQAKSPIKQLALFTKKKTLGMSAPGFTVATDVSFGGGKFDSLTIDDLASEKTYTVTITGLAKGRSHYTYAGLIIVSLMFIFGGILSWKTRPTGNIAENDLSDQT